MLSQEARCALKLAIDRATRQILTASGRAHSTPGVPAGTAGPWMPQLHVVADAHRILPSLDYYDKAA